MRLRRRRPEQRNEQPEEEFREAEQYDFDDARHFASGRSSGQSQFARRGQSHEERMVDDDSAHRFQGGSRPGEGSDARRDATRDHAAGRGQRSEHAPGTDRDGYGQPDARGYGQGRGYEGADAPGGRERGAGAGPRHGYYGSGGSYGYGGGFEHGGRPGAREPDSQSGARGRRYGRDTQGPNAYRSGGDPGPGNDEFYEATGGFGHDVSAYGRHGFGYPGRGENRFGVPGGGVHHQDARGYFNEQASRPMPGRGYFNEDLRQGFTQNSGYSQSGGERTEPTERGSGYGSSVEHSDARGHEGGGRGEHDGPRFEPRRGGSPRRTPKGYTRPDERIREDLCEQLGHSHVDPSEVSVAVANGVVTLEGFVESRREKFDLEELAASVLGVTDVENRVRVGRQERASQQLEEAKGSARESQGSAAGAQSGSNGPRGG